MPEYHEDHAASQESEQSDSVQAGNNVTVDGNKTQESSEKNGFVGFVSKYYRHGFASLIVLLVVSLGLYTLLGTHADTVVCTATTYSTSENNSPSNCVTDIQTIVNYYNSYIPGAPTPAGIGTEPFGPVTKTNVAFFQSSTNTGYPTSSFTSGVVNTATWDAFCKPINAIGTATPAFLASMKDACGNTNAYGDCYATAYTLNAKGACVKDIQTMINYYNSKISPTLAAVTVNGTYGSTTANAVKHFQQHTNTGYATSKFTSLGVVGSSTWNALCKPLKKVGTPPASFLKTMVGACNTEGIYTPTSTALAIKVSDGQLVNQDGKTIRLLGFDESGTESGCVASYPGFTGAPAGSNGSLDDSSGTPSLAVAQEEADALKADKVNAVRVPLNEDCWLGINGATAQYSGANYQTAIQDFVTALNKDNIYAILDLHWNASGTILSDFGATQGWDMPDASHAPTFWTSVATAYKSNPAVIFDLYNEPHMGDSTPTAADWACWLNGCSDTYSYTDQNTKKPQSITYNTAGMESLIQTIRATGATQPILVGGLDYSDDPCGAETQGGNGGNCLMTSAYAPKDTLSTSQLVYDFHNYCGADNGTTCTSGVTCDNTSCWNTDIAALKKAGIPWVTSELGEFDCSAQYMNSYESWADTNNVSYLAWSWIYDGSIKSCLTQTQNSNGDGANITLLSNWNGSPSTIAPEGAAFINHLQSVGLN